MLNTISINLKTDIKTDSPTTLPITLMSQDVNNNQFILRFTSDGESVALDSTYTVEILTKFTKSGTSRLTSAVVRQDYATWEFDTAYIEQDETVYNYVYVRKSGSLVVSADSNAFYFEVGLSEIDKGAGRVAEFYDENYQKHLDEFKDNVDFEEIAQAEEARKEAEILREESYEQKVDLAIVEADVVDKVDNKVTELTPQINNLTAQLAQIAYLPSSFKEITDVDDSQAINRALAHVNSLGGGKVKIPYKITPYLIGSTLKIYSNTALEVDKGTVIKLKDGANTRLIENVNMTTQDNLTIVDTNITVTGGIWDGNRSGQTRKWDGAPNVTSLILGAFFSGVKNLTLNPEKIMNTVTYACLLCNIENLEINSIEVDVGDVAMPNNCDGIHLMGPISGANIENVTVKSEDNVVALNADDVDHGPYATMGDMDNITIKNLTINNHDGGQGIRLLSGTSKIHNVLIDGVRGKAKYLAKIDTLDIGEGDFDNIRVKNVDMEWYVANYRFLNFFGNAGTLEFENIKIEGDNYLRAGNIGNIGLHVSKNGDRTSNIENLIIKDFQMDNVNGLGAITRNVYIDSNVTVNDLRLDNINSKNNVKTHYLVDILQANIENLYLRNLVENSTTNKLRIVASTVNRTIDENHIIDSFTPEVKGLTTPGTCTYTAQMGKFIKQGNRVDFQIEVKWTGHTGSGQLVLNLPHTTLSSLNEFQNVTVLGIADIEAGAQIKGLINRPGSRIQFYKVNAGAITALAVPASATLYINGYYYV